MSDWRVDLVRESYAGFNGLRIEDIEPVFHADCEWDLGDAAAAFGQETYRGHEGLRALVRDIEEIFPDWHTRIDGLRQRADGALLVRFTAGASEVMQGQGLTVRGSQVVEFRDRKILRITQFSSWEPPDWDDAEPISSD